MQNTLVWFYIKQWNKGLKLSNTNTHTQVQNELQQIFSIPKHGSINIHASVLPEYKGAAPSQRSIINGDNNINTLSALSGTMSSLNNNLIASAIV